MTKPPEFHQRAKELVNKPMPGPSMSDVEEALEILPRYVQLTELMAEEIKVLRDGLIRVSLYFDTEDEGSHECDSSYILDHRISKAKKALAEADAIEKRIWEMK